MDKIWEAPKDSRSESVCFALAKVKFIQDIILFFFLSLARLSRQMLSYHLIGEQSVRLLTNQVISIALYLRRKDVQEELRISHGFRTFFFHLASISRHDSSQRGNTIMICLQKKTCIPHKTAKVCTNGAQFRRLSKSKKMDFDSVWERTLWRVNKCSPINRAYCGPLLWSQIFLGQHK